MAKTFRKKDGTVARIEFSAEEMAERVLGIKPSTTPGSEQSPVERLWEWRGLIKPRRGKTPETAVYAVTSEKNLDLLKKRAALLKSNMTETAVRNVEKAGLLDAYAALAEDCPEGLTVHVWRSYGLVVLLQTRYGKMIGAKELAERANINKRDGKGKIVPDIDKAAKHLRLLQAMGYLTPDEEEGRWHHKGLPKSWRGV